MDTKQSKLLLLFLILNTGRAEEEVAVLDFKSPVELKLAPNNYEETFLHITDFTDFTKLPNIVTEFTICVDVRPAALLDQTVVAFGKAIHLSFSDLANGLVKINFWETGYLQQVEKPLLPKQWQKMCIAYKKPNLHVRNRVWSAGRVIGRVVVIELEA